MAGYSGKKSADARKGEQKAKTQYQGHPKTRYHSPANKGMKGGKKGKSDY